MALYTNRKISWLLNGDATDSDSGYDGTGSGLTYVAGKLRDCGSFDGSNDYVSIPEISIFNGEGDFTFCFWVNADSWAAGQYLFDYGDGTNRISIYTVDVAGTVYLCFEIKSGATIRNACLSVATLSTGTWYYVAAWRNSNNNLFISINYNSPYGAATGQAFPTFTNPAGCLGANYDHSGGWFDGKIEQFCYWDARLEQYPDIYNLYKAGAGLDWPFGGVVLADALQSTGTLAGDYIVAAMKAGTMESTGTLSASGKQADLGHFWAAVNHEDGGAYNPPGLAMITENGYKVKEISWADIDKDYDEYHSPNDFAVDNNGDIYVIGLAGATAVHKINSDGDVLWTFNIVTGSATHVVVDPTGAHVYVATEYISARLIKLNAATGAEITDGDWPLTTDQIDVPDCHTLIYGRDGYIYMSDATLAAVLIGTTGIIQKIDPGDGSIEWNWRVSADYVKHLYCIAVNASGVVVAVHDAITTNQMVSILGSDGITDRTWQYDDDFQLDDQKAVVIDDSGYIYGVNGWSGLFKCISTQTWNPYGHEEWVTEKYGFYSLSPDCAYLYGSRKIQTSDGAVIWSMDTDLIELNTIKFSGTMLTRSAWIVTIDNGANGTITTNLGAELANGNIAVADADDLVLTITPDAGYQIASVQANGEEVPE